MVKKQKQLQKLNSFQRLMDGQRAASYIHAQRGTFLLRVDEKCYSWPLSLNRIILW